MSQEKARLKGNSKRQNHAPLYLMLLPGLAYLIVNNYLPMYGLTIAFRKLDYQKGILRSPIVGFQNFEFLFKTKDAWIMIRNTVGYNIVFILLGIVVAVTIAIFMTEIGKMKIANPNALGRRANVNLASNSSLEISSGVTVTV